MSHPEQRAFIAAVARANIDLFGSARVLEVGSYDVNGSIRGLISAREYVGVDLTPGPGVDRLLSGADVSDPDGSFDVTVSAECFEHDPRWRATFTNMVRLTRPGGLVTFTCAAPGRVEHGTRRTLTTDSPGTQDAGLNYYRNLAAEDFADLPLNEWFSVWRFTGCRTRCDLYFVGVRAGQAAIPAQLPPSDALVHIDRMMPLAARAVRWPLRIVQRAARSEETYQRFAVPYWMLMMRLAMRLKVMPEPG